MLPIHFCLKLHLYMCILSWEIENSIFPRSPFFLK
jgi:hypothetical protein